MCCKFDCAHQWWITLNLLGEKELKSLAVMTFKYVSVVHPNRGGSAQPTDGIRGYGTSHGEARAYSRVTIIVVTGIPLRALP